MVQPPSPRDPAHASRWEHTRLRRRMLEGAWGDDLARRIRTQIGTTRAEGWGLPGLSANVLSSVCSQLATLYDSEPVVRHADPAGVLLADAVADGGWWELAQRVQRDTLGLREMHVRIEVTPEGELSFRPVPPDLVVAEAPVYAPEEPWLYREARLREEPGIHSSQGSTDLPPAR